MRGINFQAIDLWFKTSVWHKVPILKVFRKVKCVKSAVLIPGLSKVFVKKKQNPPLNDFERLFLYQVDSVDKGIAISSAVKGDGIVRWHIQEIGNPSSFSIQYQELLEDFM